MPSWAGTSRFPESVKPAGQRRTQSDTGRTNSGDGRCTGSYVVLDLAASVGIDGQPSLLVLRLDVGVFGGQRVLHLEASGNSSHLSVPRVGQHFGQLHQEGRLRRKYLIAREEAESRESRTKQIFVLSLRVSASYSFCWTSNIWTIVQVECDRPMCPAPSHVTATD